MTAPVVKPAKKAPVRRPRKPKAPPHITDAVATLGRGSGHAAFAILWLNVYTTLLREGHDVTEVKLKVLS